ncbi:hypothetical protein [Chitiniphilus eburneus]|uniref:EI24 domain-containing protein n=1 Tax=Chitiniphilus eburneus TaxID=2571148 RepID=A0A4U0PXZ7_9NEIS|nr:hypothetical protein [Chitiniphilus eburneus]TJZ73476.1 hypothetical protein FAZ21_09785 [Chitiniphilus eburneus]
MWRHALVSLGAWLLALLAMLSIYLLAWTPLSNGMQRLARFMILGLPGYFGWSPDPQGWLAHWIQGAEALLGYGLMGAAFLLGLMLLARLMLELVLMGAVQRHVLRRYPALSDRVQRPWRVDLRDLVGNVSTLVIGSLICLCIPVVGGLLMIALNAYLNVRGLVNDAFDGVASEAL